MHEKVHDAFVAAFLATVNSFKAGDPMNDDSYIGAITRAPQLDVLDAQVADAKAKGATLLCGGSRMAGPFNGQGNWYAPTVFGNVDHSMSLMREESFGPIIGIQKVSGDEEAVKPMNDSRYGLTAGVFTPDQARAQALLSRVNAGSVYWNCCDRVSPRLPWSGHGDSGIGLTLSTYGIQAFTRPKAWHVVMAFCGTGLLPIALSGAPPRKQALGVAVLAAFWVGSGWFINRMFLAPWQWLLWVGVR